MMESDTPGRRSAIVALLLLAAAHLRSPCLHSVTHYSGVVSLEGGFADCYISIMTTRGGGREKES